MPVHRLTIAYTGRDELARCRTLIEEFGEDVTEFGGPADVGVSAAGSHIFRAAEIARCRFGIVNLHLAPLPEYRGRYSAGHALANGDVTYAVTLHYIDEGIDTGPVIARSEFPIAPGETVASLRARAVDEGLALFERVLPHLLRAAHNGHGLPASPQDESRARYYDRHTFPP